MILQSVSPFHHLQSLICSCDVSCSCIDIDINTMKQYKIARCILQKYIYIHGYTIIAIALLQGLVRLIPLPALSLNNRSKLFGRYNGHIELPNELSGPPFSLGCSFTSHLCILVLVVQGTHISETKTNKFKFESTIDRKLYILGWLFDERVVC